MKRTLAFILSMMMVLTIMPASFLTALANGLGVRGDYTPNLSIDNATHTETWIPASIVVDGEIDDTGWIRDQWNEVNSATGTWNVVTPQHGDLSYEYQVQRDHQYLYGAYVIDMKSVESGEPNKIALWLNDGTNGGSSWTQKIVISVTANTDGTYSTEMTRYYNDGNGGAAVSETLYANTGIYLDDNDYYVNSEAPAVTAVRVAKDGQVPTDRIIVEFRTLLDVFSDQKAYDEAADKSAFKYNDENNLSECESIKHFTVVEFAEISEGLYYPRLSTSEDRVMESPDSAWPSDAVEITEADVMNNDGTADYNNVLPSGMDIDGVFSEGVWSAISDFCQYGWATGAMTDDYRAEGTYGGAELAAYKNLWFKNTNWGENPNAAPALSTNTDAIRFKYDIGVDKTYFYGAMVIYSDEAAAENLDRYKATYRTNATNTGSGNINLRDLPTTGDESTVIVGVPHGTDIEVTGYTTATTPDANGVYPFVPLGSDGTVPAGAWARVTYQGQTGWMRSDYIIKVSDNAVKVQNELTVTLDTERSNSNHSETTAIKLYKGNDQKADDNFYQNDIQILAGRDNFAFTLSEKNGNGIWNSDNNVFYDHYFDSDSDIFNMTSGISAKRVSKYYVQVVFRFTFETVFGSGATAWDSSMSYRLTVSDGFGNTAYSSQIDAENGNQVADYDSFSWHFRAKNTNSSYAGGFSLSAGGINVQNWPNMYAADNHVTYMVRSESAMRQAVVDDDKLGTVETYHYKLLTDYDYLYGAAVIWDNEKWTKSTTKFIDNDIDCFRIWINDGTTAASDDMWNVTISFYLEDTGNDTYQPHVYLQGEYYPVNGGSPMTLKLYDPDGIEVAIQENPNGTESSCDGSGEIYQEYLVEFKVPLSYLMSSLESGVPAYSESTTIVTDYSGAVNVYDAVTVFNETTQKNEVVETLITGVTNGKTISINSDYKGAIVVRDTAGNLIDSTVYKEAPVFNAVVVASEWNKDYAGLFHSEIISGNNFQIYNKDGELVYYSNFPIADIDNIDAIRDEYLAKDFLVSLGVYTHGTDVNTFYPELFTGQYVNSFTGWPEDSDMTFTYVQRENTTERLDYFNLDGKLEEFFWNNEAERVLVNGGNGYWAQLPAGSEEFDYEYRIYTSNENIYGAFKLNAEAVVDKTLLNVWFNVNENATADAGATHQLQFKLVKNTSSEEDYQFEDDDYGVEWVLTGPDGHEIATSGARLADGGIEQYVRAVMKTINDETVLEFVMDIDLLDTAKDEANANDVWKEFAYPVYVYRMAGDQTTLRPITDPNDNNAEYKLPVKEVYLFAANISDNDKYWAMPNGTDGDGNPVGFVVSESKVSYYYKDVTYKTPFGTTNIVRLFYSNKARTDEYLVYSLAEARVGGYAQYGEAAKLDRIPHYPDTARDGFEYVVGVSHPVGDETLTLYHNGNGSETFWVSGYNWKQDGSLANLTDHYTNGAGIVLNQNDVANGNISVGPYASIFVFEPADTLDGIYKVTAARVAPCDNSANVTIGATGSDAAYTIPENGFAYVIHCTDGGVKITTYAKQAFEKANADFTVGAYIKFTDFVLADNPAYSEFAYFDTVPNTVIKGSIKTEVEVNGTKYEGVRGDSLGSSIDIYDAGYASLADYTVVDYDADNNTIDASCFPDSQNGWSSRGKEVPCLTDYIIEKITVDGEHNDTGWDENGWIYVDNDVNANLQTVNYDAIKEGVEYAYKYQIRTDGEYIYVAAVLDTGMKKDNDADTDTGAYAPYFRIWFNNHDTRNSGDDGNDYNRLTFSTRYEIVGANVAPAWSANDNRYNDLYIVDTPAFDSRTYLNGWSITDITKTNTFGEVMNVPGEDDVNLDVTTSSGNLAITYDNVQFRVGQFTWETANGDVDYANPTGGVSPNPDINGSKNDYTVTNTFNYGDSAFFGYTEIIEENTTNGSFFDTNDRLHDTDLNADGRDGTNFEDGWVAERALRQVTYGNEHATMVEKNGQTYVEFKIGIDEVADENGEFEYSVFAGLDTGSIDYVQFYPMVDKEAGIYFPSGYDRFYNPNWYWPTNAFEWNADVEQDLMLRSPYEPVVNIGGQYVADYYGDESNKNALKLGGYYIQEYIARQMRDDYGDVIDEKILSGWDYWDVLEMGLIYKAAQLMGADDELKILTPSTVTEGATDVEADNIENWNKENAEYGYSVFADYKTFVYYAAIVGIPDYALNLKYNYRCYVDYYGNDGAVDPYEGKENYYLEYYQTNIQDNPNFIWNQDGTCKQTVDCIGDYILEKDSEGNFIEITDDGSDEIVSYVAKYDEFYAPMVNRSCTMVKADGDIATFQKAHNSTQTGTQPYDETGDASVIGATIGYVPYDSTLLVSPVALERVEYAAQASGFNFKAFNTLPEARAAAVNDGISNWILCLNEVDDTTWEALKSFAENKNVVVVYPDVWTREIPSELADSLTVISGLGNELNETFGLVGLAAYTSKYVAKGNVNLHVHYYGENTNLVESYIDELGVTANKNNAQGIEVLVLTSTEQVAVNNLLADLSDNLSEGIPTTVINTVDGAMGYKFNDIKKDTLVDFDELLVTIPNIGRMLGYSSWKDENSSALIALSTALSRYAYLEIASEITDESHTGFVKSLAFALISDIAYEIDYKNVDVSTAEPEELGVAAIRNKAFQVKADEIANYINCSDIISVITDSKGRTDIFGGGKLLIGNLEYKMSGSQITELPDLGTAGNTADMIDCDRPSFDIFITDGINHAYEGAGGEVYINTALNTTATDNKQHTDATVPVLQYPEDVAYIYNYDGSFGNIDADDMSDGVINIALNGDLNDGQTNATIIGGVLPDIITDKNITLGVESGKWFAFVDDRISYDTRWNWEYVKAGTDGNGKATAAHYKRITEADFIAAHTDGNGTVNLDPGKDGPYYYNIYVWSYKRVDGKWQTVWSPARLYVESWSAVDGKHVFLEDEVEGKGVYYQASNAGLYTAYWQHCESTAENLVKDPINPLNETPIYLGYGHFGEHFYRYATGYASAPALDDSSKWNTIAFNFTNTYTTGGSIDNLSIPLESAQSTPVTNEGFSNGTYYNDCDYKIFWYSRIVNGNGGTNSFWKYGQAGYGEIIIDVGAVENLEAIRLHLGNASSAMAWSPAMEVFYTTDTGDFGEGSDMSAVSWKKICNVAAEYTLLNEHVYWTTASLDGVSSRYIKVRFALNNGDVYYVDEVEVYGSPDTSLSTQQGINFATYNVGQLREVFSNSVEYNFGNYSGADGYVDGVGANKLNNYTVAHGDNGTAGFIKNADGTITTAAKVMGDAIAQYNNVRLMYKQQPLDVIVLQEVNQYVWRYGAMDQVKLIAEAAGYKYYYYASANEFDTAYTNENNYNKNNGIVDDPTTRADNPSTGVAILSNYPIVAARTYYQSSGESSVAYAQIDVNGTYVDIYSTHFANNQYDRAATHDKRMDQYALINHVLENRTEYSIVGGDFNERWLSTYGENVDGMDILLDKSDGEDVTIQDGSGNRKVIDNILYSGNDTVKRVGLYVLDNTWDNLNQNDDNPSNVLGFSDHYMATATFEFLPQ